MNYHCIFRAVSSTASTILFPILTWTMKIALFACAIFIGLKLQLIGTQINHVVQLDNASCECSGKAELYEDTILCDPEMFSEKCKKWLVNENVSVCSMVACELKQIPPYLPYVKVCFSILSSYPCNLDPWLI